MECVENVRLLFLSEKLTLPESVTHQDLFKDGFPYAYLWLSNEGSDAQIFVAKSKPNIVKADLKRALGGATSDAAEKKPKLG